MSSPEFSVTLKCTALRTVGPRPFKVWVPGEILTIESDNYRDFVRQCAEHEAHFREVVEGEWPSRRVNLNDIDLRPRTSFAHRIKTKAQRVIKMVTSQDSRFVCEVEGCKKKFKNKEALDRHADLHAKRGQTQVEKIIEEKKRKAEFALLEDIKVSDPEEEKDSPVEPEQEKQSPEKKPKKKTKQSKKRKKK